MLASSGLPFHQRLKAIDVFSGCGGLTRGLLDAGFEVLAGIEICPIARSAYSLNYPKIHLFEDVRSVSASDILEKFSLAKGELSLLAGCPPCQGFSRLRTLNNESPVPDPRNKLIFDFIRLAEGLLPKTIMLENVPGLLTNWRLAEAKRRLSAAGYNCVAGVLNAATFGVPQRRKRMILLASRMGPIILPSGNAKIKTVRDAIGNIPSPQKSRKWLHKLRATHSAEVARRIESVPHDGGSRAAWGAGNQLKCHRNKEIGFRDIYGRMSWDKVSPTITRYCTNPSKGRFLHPVQNRALSVYEAALLQSFPRSYRFPRDASGPQIASLIGEALPPLFARAQARHLLEHLLAH
ncbi:MAG: DNA cytosine methyltransferase [Verrucomicrobia bacterium]|nr:DNA cytosine methyltransferase [Verrucomicrobiota bacterium]